MFPKTQLACAIALATSVLTFPQAFAAEEAETKAKDKLEVIEVTATRRVQNINDVPVSIAAISEERFANLMAGGGDILTLALQVPGLYAESSNGRVAPRFYIRGLGNTDFDLAASQPVSVIMDDVVMENVILKSFPLFDVQQVEVLRGPQGTLFGRNTTAGIVKFDTVKPTQDLDGYLKLGAGSYGSQIIEGAVGGGLTDAVSVRLSVKDDRRDDWVSNGYTGEENVMGGHVDTAVRAQIQADITDSWDVGFSYQQRELDGTSTLFRANVLTAGSNKLNENYKRDEVYYDAPMPNYQKYDSQGYTLRSNLDLDIATLSYIGSLQKAEGGGYGDIDGGYGASYLPEMGPGFIPFDSQTADGAIVEQMTHELRLASNNVAGYSWQTGVYWFDGELQVETNPFFVDPSTVKHENKTWALFGQGTYDVNDELTLTGGVRYTKDEKSLKILAAPIMGDDVATDDGKVSWEAAANYAMDDNWNLFTRLATGFRAPTIQGRDVAFFGVPSVAKSETVTSFEVGTKGDLLDDTLRLNTAVFAYQVDDMQFTAVGGSDNLVQLLNADKGQAYGVEMDLEWVATENLLFTAGFSYTKTEIQDNNLKVGVCAQCTVTDPLQDGYALVDGNPFPQAPDLTANFTARWSKEVGNGEVYAFTDWSYQGETNLFIYESVEYNTNGQFEGGIRLGYNNFEHDIDFSFYGRNITNEHNIKGGIDFNNNTAFVNEPRIIGLEVTKRFY
ncbi:TonB-dependent receptor [Paraferrimonas sp. SM1919]|uniref:TonB-dependent receptor n=1 Tax=Paraferrimonas sp. SM1919 TaxID=2662263 RepID=UPI0013D470D8|nr:TonB-dependent receptor [Paraferrimonas sp. SM1919]